MRLAEDGPVGFGKSGSFEGFCSGGGIAQLARSKAVEAIQNGLSPAYCPTMESLEAISAKTRREAAHAGDATAQKVYRLCGEKLGMGLALITDIINPEIIVIGSIFERSHSLLWPAAKEVWEREAASLFSTLLQNRSRVLRGFYRRLRRTVRCLSAVIKFRKCPFHIRIRRSLQ